MRPPIFIVGCPRSGTTLLRDLLNLHPDLAFPPESHFIPRLYKAYGDPRSDREARKLAAAVLRTSWIRNWGLEMTPADFASCRSYREFVARLFEAWARREGKSRWGDKTPVYVVDIATLLEVFPTCKIIHIYRDGRDVALSWIGFRYGPGNVLSAAQQWKRHVTLGRRAGAALPPATYLEVRYERLVAEPEVTLKAIYAFLDEPYCPPVPIRDRGQTPPRRFWIGAQAPSWAYSAEIVRSNSGKWKDGMTRSDRVLFESAAADLLRELDYETEGLGRDLRMRELLVGKLQNACWYVFWRLNRTRKRQWVAGELGLRWAEVRHRLRRAGRGLDTRPPSG